MTPTFRKRYGSTRERDVVLIYQITGAEGGTYRITDAPITWSNHYGMWGVWTDEPEPEDPRLTEQTRWQATVPRDRNGTPLSAEAYREYQRQMRDQEIVRNPFTGCPMTLAQEPASEVSYSDDYACVLSNSTLPPQLTVSVTFAENRKPFNPHVSGLKAVSGRHAAWLTKMSGHRPDAFALKQRLAQEASEAATSSEVADAKPDAS